MRINPAYVRRLEDLIGFPTSRTRASKEASRGTCRCSIERRKHPGLAVRRAMV
jgi:hypothetical protein